MLNQLWARSLRNRSFWLAIGVGLVLTAFALPLARRAIILSDEGFLLQQALDMLHGKVLYRDMVTIVTPGVWFLVAGLFSIVEPSVLASRMLALGAYLAMVGVSYRIVASLTTRRHGLVAILLMMILTVWAFPTWMLAWYSPFAILFALGGLERILAWRQSQHRRDLLWSGLLFGLSIACKQNYGLYAALGGGLSLLFLRLEAREERSNIAKGLALDALCLTGGGLLVALPLVAYFAYVGALGNFIDSTILRMFEFASTSDVPFLKLETLWNLNYWRDGSARYTYLSVPMIEAGVPSSWIFIRSLVLRLHVLLYWIPFVVFLLTAALACAPILRRDSFDGGLASVGVVCGLLFLGVLPRADFNHLINVYQPVVVAGVVVAHRLGTWSPTPRPSWVKLCRSVGGALIFSYAAIAVFWYSALLDKMNTAVDMPRGGVLVDSSLANKIEYYVGKIRDLTEEGEPVLTVPDLAMFNFLTDRPLPGAYYELYEHMIGHDAGAGVVEAVEVARVRLVVARYNNFFSHRVGLREYAPILAGYLRTNFREEEPAGDSGFMYLVRREEPLPEVERRNVLADCDVPGKSEGNRQIRAHLLFTTLYHRFWDAEQRSAPVVTRCLVKVPERAELALQLLYRKPALVQENAAFQAEIFVESDGVTRELTSETLRLIPYSQEGENVREIHIDLSKYANHEVVITFRTGRRGAVRSRPSFDPMGLALEWKDPHIESRAESR